MRRLFWIRTLVWAIFVCVACVYVSQSSVNSAQGEADLPNILWITSEDNSAHWMGCYGDDEAETPRLDQLAAEGVQFNKAYSNAPVCAVARSTLLNGAYAVTQGTQHMRSRYPIEPKFKPYVSYLRAAGYYTTNRAKTDYNREGDDRAIWDACSNRAHYRNRPEGVPFFAVINLTVNHESCLFPERVQARRDQGVFPETPRLDPKTLSLPAHLPDLPAVREDFAIYHDAMTAMDRQVGELLDELEDLGLAEDTIVIYCSDHGGITPRSKRYLTDTGVHVPLLVRVPQKWRHLSPYSAGETTDELVAFVDFAPTLLSLAGIEMPPQMHGRAFLGNYRAEPEDDATVFLFADRFDEVPGMSRGITDGRYKYIRHFTPHLPRAPLSMYSLQMPSWKAWQQAWESGELSGFHAEFWQPPRISEALYDTANDPWEVENLAENSSKQDVLLRLREKLKQRMRETADTGIVPEGFFEESAPGIPISTWMAREDVDYGSVLELAFLASERDKANLPQLTAAMQDPNPVARYWGALGCMLLATPDTSAIEGLKGLLEDRHATNRITAAHALIVAGHDTLGKRALIDECVHRKSNDASRFLLHDTLARVDALEDIPDQWIESVLEDGNAHEYHQRFAQRLKDARQ